MIIDRFLGSEDARARLRAMLQAGQLPHSVLICGETGCGSGYFARLLAADLLQCDPSAADGEARARRVLEGSDPDCIEVEGEGVSGQIKVDRIREVRAAAQQTSLGGERRVIIVYGAENLAAPSANALLKILEEPPEGVFFLITARSAAGVMDTIRSRCSALQLTAPSAEICAAELCRRGASSADAALLAKVWQGRIGSALACLNGERRTLFDAAFAGCRCVAAADAYGLMKLFVPYEKEREQLQTLLADMVQILSGCFAGLDSCPAAGETAVPAIRAILDAAARLRGNGNARLVLTGLCLQLGE